MGLLGGLIAVEPTLAPNTWQSAKRRLEPGCWEKGLRLYVYVQGCFVL
jgi:hypothetical protein